MMRWSKTFVKEYTGVSQQLVWDTWQNVENWPSWDSELEHCKLHGNFETGGKFDLKIKNGPLILMHLDDVIEPKTFMDRCDFFGASMYDFHEVMDVPDGVRIVNTITVTGPLAYLWVFLVAKNVFKGIQAQTDRLIQSIQSK